MKNLNKVRPVSDDKWRKVLSPKEYYVLRKHGTEAPFQGKYLHEKRKGFYVCSGCGTKVFDSSNKYESRTGWPSFFKSESDNVQSELDFSLLFPRTEIHCKKCGGHLGHVFDDGPSPTGKRYCVNSAALKFKAK